MKRQQIFQIKGMNRDISPSKTATDQSGFHYAYEIKNMRITAQEDETQLSLINERGNKQYSIVLVDNTSFEGTIIGYCTIKDTLVLFTHANDGDNIYKLEITNDYTLAGTRLYHGELGFTNNMILETLGIYESDVIQKVYWLDGKHQPRFINIAADYDTQLKWGRIANPFDFITDFKQDVNVEITRSSYSGSFPACTVQYAMTYYNRNGQQTNVFYASPIFYASHNDRGAAADESISNSFTIKIENADPDFDYIRIYSIIRTTANSTPFCRILQDVPITPTTTYKNSVTEYTVSPITIVDTGIYGDTVDPYEILYAGGRDVIPETMAQKDNTLFFGNITTSRELFPEGIASALEQNFSSTDNSRFEYFRGSYIDKGSTGSLYMYSNQLHNNSQDITTFKGGETYRFGLIFQDTKGIWSNVVYLGDKHNSLYPNDELERFQTVKGKFTIPSDIAAAIYEAGYRKVRGVVVYPTYADREVVCQGVLCPTVYNINDRINNTPYAQSSWFFRDMHKGSSKNEWRRDNCVQNRHNYNICNALHATFDRTSSDIQSLTQGEIYGASDISVSAIKGATTRLKSDGKTRETLTADNLAMDMFVDWNVVTLNTPDLDFEDTVFPEENLKLRIVGAIPLTSCANDIRINTSTAPQDATLDNFRKVTFSHSNLSSEGNKIRMSDFDWYDKPYENEDVKRDNNILSAKYWRYPIFPWHKSRSLISQVEIQDDDAYGWISQLNTKTISNIRTSAQTLFFSNAESSNSYNISNVGLYNGTNVLSRLERDINDKDYTSIFNYYGEVDNLLVPTGEGYPTIVWIYNKETEDTSSQRTDRGSSRTASSYITFDAYTTEGIRMKYKSGKHAVFQLKYTDDGKQTILPALKIGSTTLGKQTEPSGVPMWSERKDDASAVTQISQDTIDLGNSNSKASDYVDYGFMYIGELYRDNVSKETMFGGTTESAKQGDTWNVAGNAVSIGWSGDVIVPFSQGDTYYQRYDCLKTYPYTNEDANQIVEILSFMCETRINIDGRYDTQRGLSSNLNIRPENFNLLNPVYTQNNNFFSTNYLSYDNPTTTKYPNTVMWTKTKTYGEDIDSWTSIQQTSLLDLDGDKGSINALINYKNNLIAFQDNVISQIQYNERIQVNTSDGVPIEISNSNKVDGKVILFDHIGCSNKRTIQTTPIGLYFMDGNSKDIYIFSNGNVASLSKAKGFNKYLYEKDFTKYHVFYDKKASDLYFVDNYSCLVYNEQLREFTGFYSYENTDFMFNLKDHFAAIKDNTIWHQFAGEYNHYFGDNYQPFYVEVICNQGLNDKIFGNLDFLADTWDSKDNLLDKTFDTLSAWDEYQFGISNLRTINKNNRYWFSNLKKKFRIWRADIPRAMYLPKLVNIEAIEETVDNIEAHITDIQEIKYEFNIRTSMDRIRNTWAYIKLSMQKENNNKTILHNMTVGYYE